MALIGCIEVPVHTTDEHRDHSVVSRYNATQIVV